MLGAFLNRCILLDAHNYLLTSLCASCQHDFAPAMTQTNEPAALSMEKSRMKTMEELLEDQCTVVRRMLAISRCSIAQVARVWRKLNQM